MKKQHISTVDILHNVLKTVFHFTGNWNHHFLIKSLSVKLLTLNIFSVSGYFAAYMVNA